MSSISYLVALLLVSEAAILFFGLRYGRKQWRWVREKASGRWLAISIGIFAGWLVSNVVALTAITVAWDVWGWVPPDEEFAWWSFVFVLAAMVGGGFAGYRVRRV